MSTLAPDTGALEGARTRQRDSMLLMGTIKEIGDFARQTQPIRIRNLSTTGMMAVSNAAYDVGAIVEIGLRGIGIVTGEIVWVEDGRMGVTFREPIDPMRARRKVSTQPDEHLRKIVTVGKIRRPGLRID